MVLESAGGCCESIINVLESPEGCREDICTFFQLKYQWFWNQQEAAVNRLLMLWSLGDPRTPATGRHRAPQAGKPPGQPASKCH